MQRRTSGRSSWFPVAWIPPRYWPWPGEQGFELLHPEFRLRAAPPRGVGLPPSGCPPAMGVAEHKVVKLNLDSIGGSALTDMAIACAVPEEETEGIPITYVPARNTVFLSIALGWAEVLGAQRHLHRRQRGGLLRLPRLPPRVSSPPSRPWPTWPPGPGWRAEA